MKNFSPLLSLFFALILAGSNLIAQENLIVLVKYKTQPSAEITALQALNHLIDEVKKEPNYVKIVMHVDPNDQTNILLYEEWSDEDYYKGNHMKTTHLQKFISDSREFLAGPPEISFWRIKN